MVAKNPKRVLVSGVAGFIGRHIVRHFNMKGYRTAGIDFVQEENAGAYLLEKYYQRDLRTEGIESILTEQRPHLFVHCAGRASVDLSINDPASDFTSSVPMTFSILDSIRKYVPHCKLIFLSSAAVYGNPGVLPVSERSAVAPISPYGYHKLACELMCKEFSVVYGLKTAIIRIFSAYGPGLRRQVLWDICFKAIENRKAVRLRGRGTETRDFVHVKDISSAVEVVYENGECGGEVYNLGSGEEISIAKVAEILLGAMEVEREIVFDGNVPKGIPSNWCADIAKIEGIGFKVKVDPKKGIRKYGKWFLRENDRY